MTAQSTEQNKFKNDLTMPAIGPDSRTTGSSHTHGVRTYLRDAWGQAALVGFGETYISAFAVFLKCSANQLATIVTLPPFLGAIFQTVGVYLMEQHKKRRAIFVKTASIQALIWTLLALLLFLYPEDLTFYAVLALIIGHHSLSGIGAPPWSSLVGDLIPSSSRGRYFALRTKIMGFTTFICLLLAGYLLDFFSSLTHPAYGFAVIFALAGLSRAISAYRLSAYREHDWAITDVEKFSYWDFLRRMPHSNFAKFVLFVALVNFSVNIAAPFFAPYMLTELHFDYSSYTLVVAMAVVSQFLTLNRWGALSDYFGNKRILNVTAFGTAIIPFLWLFGSSIWYLVCVQLWAGFMWAGFNLAAGNFLFDAVSPPKRARCVAYQGLMNGSFVILGSLLGSYLATHPSYAMHIAPSESQYLGIFAFSGVARVLTTLFFLRLFKEVRTVPEISNRKLVFSIVHVRPFAGASFLPDTSGDDVK